MTNFPTTDGQRLAVTISPGAGSVTLTLGGARPAGAVLFQLPSFVHNIAGTSAGSVTQGTGTVRLSRDVRRVTVRYRHPPA